MQRPRFLTPDDSSTFAKVWNAESGVHAIADVVREDNVESEPVMSPFLEQVTLIVYGWKNVEPGTLSWVFPSITAALVAAHTMTNATRWQIVSGPRPRDAEVDVEQERSSGTVLVEEAG